MGAGSTTATVWARQLPPTWSPEDTWLAVLSSAKLMWAQPCSSRAIEMKSARWRFDARGGQAMPRLQMSPACIGALVTWVVVQVGS